MEPQHDVESESDSSASGREGLRALRSGVVLVGLLELLVTPGTALRGLGFVGVVMPQRELDHSLCGLVHFLIISGETFIASGSQSARADPCVVAGFFFFLFSSFF